MDTSRTTDHGLTRFFRNLLNLGIGSYGLAVSGFIILRMILNDSWLPIALYNTFAHLLWLIALPLLLFALLLRFWRAALLLFLPAGAFVFSYGGQFLGPADDYIGTSAFSVITYNIKWRSSDYADTIDIILNADTDIVAIQELGTDAAARLEDGLAGEYPYLALHPHRTGTVGQGILSRYPIVEDEVWQSEFLPASFMQQRVVIDVDSAEIVIYNLHLNHPFIGGGFNAHQRTLQVEDALRRIAAEQSRVILLGDLNLVDLNDDYARLREQLTDAYFDVGWGLGWTFSYGGFRRLPPMARLDYIFFNSYGLDGVEARVWAAAGGSDHHPVRAQLSIFDPTASYP
jgi:endonuclease/exonuclease/phosphatase (EEP) superfamily protein YafD